jgi:excisionase family DNA binding protein
MTPTPSRLPHLLTVDSVAKRLDVSVKTTRRLIDRGDLPVHRIGRLIRVSESDLFLYLEHSRLLTPQ